MPFGFYSSDDYTETSREQSSIVVPGRSLESGLTLPNFVSLMSELGVKGPSYNETNLDSLYFKKIGAGAQFEVYKSAMGGNSVIKRVRPLVPIADRTELRDLELEIRVLANRTVRKHPNIIRLLEWGLDHPYESSEREKQINERYKVGVPVPTLLVEQAAFSLDQFLQMDAFDNESISSWALRYQSCLDVAAGIECLRECGVLHNDLKPQNILVCKTQNPKVPFTSKLADFGLALAGTDNSELSFRSYGATKEWKPPESRDYDVKRHGRASSQLLFKCESYAYGLIALYTISASRNGDYFRPSSLDHEQGRSEVQRKIAEQKTYSISEKESALDFQSIIENLFLKEDPRARCDVSPWALKMDTQTFNDWQDSFHASVKQADVDDVGIELSPLRSQFWYYTHLKHGIHQLLMPQESSVLEDYPGSVIWGTALGCSKVRLGNYHQTVRKLVNAATKAESPSLVAIGVLKRVNDATSSYATHSSITENNNTTDLLRQAVVSGSFLAFQDLQELSAQRASKAIREFKSRGGYNSESLVLSELSPTRLGRGITSVVEITKHVGIDELPLHISNDTFRQILLNNHNTILHLAAMFGLSDIIQQLVIDGAILVDARNAKGETPLYKACLAGQYPSVKALMDLGANPDIRVGPLNITCLHWLFNFQPEEMNEVASLLLSKNLTVDERAFRAPRSSTASYGYFEEALHFPCYWPMGTPLHWAAHVGSIPAVDTLLQHGAYIDQVDAPNDDYAATALSTAIFQSSSRMVNHLLSKGANAKRIDGVGRTLLHILTHVLPRTTNPVNLAEPLSTWCYHGDFNIHLTETQKCINAVKAAGCPIDVKSPDGTNPAFNTPLLEAARGKNSGAVIALLDAGADTSIVDRAFGVPALGLWIHHSPGDLPYPESYFDVLQMLIEHTGDFRGTSGGNAIHHAFYRNTNLPFDFESWEITLDMLVNHPKKPADINAQDEAGRTPLMAWIELRARPGLDHCRGIKFLQSIGADITIRDHRNRDFIWHAAMNPSLDDQVCLEVMKLYLDSFQEKCYADILNESWDTKTGASVLMVFCKNAFVNCVEFAIQHGVDVNYCAKDGKTALDTSIDAGDHQRLNVLRYFAIHLNRMPTASDTVTDDFFDTNPKDGWVNSRVDSKYQYFALPKIIMALANANAKTGKQLGKRKFAPTVILTERQKFEAWEWANFRREQQPYYQLWKKIYEYDDNNYGSLFLAIAFYLEKSKGRIFFHSDNVLVPALLFFSIGIILCIRFSAVNISTIIGTVLFLLVSLIYLRKRYRHPFKERIYTMNKLLA